MVSELGVRVGSMAGECLIFACSELLFLLAMGLMLLGGEKIGKLM